MSDNGGLSAVARGGEKHSHNLPLKSGKGSIYEGGIRVPMLAYWPRKSLAGSTNATPLIIEDFFPSLLEMAQIEANDIPQKVDGRSFTSLLQQSETATQERSLFWHYPNEWGPEGPGIGSYSAVRKGDWKLIYFHTNQTFELYNLKNDIGENQNLVTSEMEKVKELANTLTAHLKLVNAQMPRDKFTQEIVAWPSIALTATK
jgi:arylsulfatase A-like enzyme